MALTLTGVLCREVSACLQRHLVTHAAGGLTPHRVQPFAIGFKVRLLASSRGGSDVVKDFRDVTSQSQLVQGQNKRPTKKKSIKEGYTSPSKNLPSYVKVNDRKPKTTKDVRDFHIAPQGTSTSTFAESLRKVSEVAKWNKMPKETRERGDGLKMKSSVRKGSTSQVYQGKGSTSDVYQGKVASANNKPGSGQKSKNVRNRSTNDLHHKAAQSSNAKNGEGKQSRVENHPNLKERSLESLGFSSDPIVSSKLRNLTNIKDQIRTQKVDNKAKENENSLQGSQRKEMMEESESASRDWMPILWHEMEDVSMLSEQRTAPTRNLDRSTKEVSNRNQWEHSEDEVNVNGAGIAQNLSDMPAYARKKETAITRPDSEENCQETWIPLYGCQTSRKDVRSPPASPATSDVISDSQTRSPHEPILCVTPQEIAKRKSSIDACAQTANTSYATAGVADNEPESHMSIESMGNMGPLRQPLEGYKVMCHNDLINEINEGVGKTKHNLHTENWEPCYIHLGSSNSEGRKPTTEKEEMMSSGYLNESFTKSMEELATEKLFGETFAILNHETHAPTTGVKPGKLTSKSLSPGTDDELNQSEIDRREFPVITGSSKQSLVSNSTNHNMTGKKGDASKGKMVESKPHIFMHEPLTPISNFPQAISRCGSPLPLILSGSAKMKSYAKTTNTNTVVDVRNPEDFASAALRNLIKSKDGRDARRNKQRKEEQLREIFPKTVKRTKDDHSASYEAKEVAKSAKQLAKPGHKSSPGKAPTNVNDRRQTMEEEVSPYFQHHQPPHDTVDTSTFYHDVCKTYTGKKVKVKAKSKYPSACGGAMLKEQDNLNLPAHQGDLSDMCAVWSKRSNKNRKNKKKEMTEMKMIDSPMTELYPGDSKSMLKYLDGFVTMTAIPIDVDRPPTKSSCAQRSKFQPQEDDIIDLSVLSRDRRVTLPPKDDNSIILEEQMARYEMALERFNERSRQDRAVKREKKDEGKREKNKKKNRKDKKISNGKFFKAPPGVNID